MGRALSAGGFDAIVLAGGRSRRLGGTPKALLTRDGETLAARTVAAVADAGVRTLVVVGPFDLPGLPDLPDLPAAVIRCREDPPFGGPVAGIAAGLAALAPPAGASTGPDPVLVLGCDMPRVRDAVLPLLSAAAGEAGPGAHDALLAQPAGADPQPLVGLFAREALSRAIAAEPAAGRSVRSVLAGLRWAAVPVPAGSCDDVDTWDDARRLGWS